MHVTSQDQRDYDLMLSHEPLFDIVKRLTPIRIVLRSRATVNGRRRDGEWVLSKSTVRVSHNCVVCRKVYTKQDGVRMYKPPLDYPADLRCCEACGEKFDQF